MDFNDFGSSLLQDASTLAGVATAAGSNSIYGDITGVNPAQASIGNNQLLLLVLIGLVMYFVMRKG